MDVTLRHASQKPGSHHAADEQERRLALVRAADHENLLEGQARDPATDHIFEAFVSGQIEAHEIVPRLKAFREQVP